MSNAAPDVQPVAPGPYALPPASRRSGCLGALLVVVFLLFGVSVLVNVALLRKKVPKGPRMPEPLAEKWVDGEGPDKLALVELSGVIMDEVRPGGIFGIPTRLLERIRRELDLAAADAAVKAVVFAVDSPGGTVTTSDDILHEFERFRERTKKPVVVHMGAMAASGGYYVSMGADQIVAEPTCITGSIGVILMSFNVSGLLQKLDIQNVTIKSGANKDLLNPFKPVNEEQVRILQGMIDSAYDRFLEVVARGRERAGLKPDELRQLADGRIYTAKEALEAKLIDRIGYRTDAFDVARRLVNLEKATVVRYCKPPSFLEALTGDPELSALRARLPLSLETLAGLETPRLLYLWSPAAAVGN